MYLGNYKAALADFDSLVEDTRRLATREQHSFVLDGRAWLRATCPDASIRNAQLAITDAKKACELARWRHAGYIDTLAAAYAEAGDFDSAVRYEQQAIVANESDASDTAAEVATGMSKKIAQRLTDLLAYSTKQRRIDFAKRVDLYKQHRPYREAAPPW